jgi:hypothetical protein
MSERPFFTLSNKNPYYSAKWMLIKFNKNSVSDFSFRFARSETVELAMCERIRGAIYTTLSAEIKI